MHLYHATPLHYLPHILQSGALYAKSVTSGSGIRPRSSAVRRDKMLGLADWVHLSLRPDTPLLRDKLQCGYPHALLVFDRAAVLNLPEVALLPYNTKAWRTRAAYVPVTNPGEKAELLCRHEETGRFPSLEVLVHYGLDFAALQRIAFVTDTERMILAELAACLGLCLPAPLTAAELFPGAIIGSEALGATQAYFDECRVAGRLLPPPAIVFD